ncbi:MAG TPA: hypothetical protein VEI97_00130 [bacterium]|nr:hypothetical protein [bacterium]
MLPRIALLSALALCAQIASTPAPCQAQTIEKTTLNVACYAYVPEAAYAIENLENAFEATPVGSAVDLHIDLIDPYDESNLVAVLQNYDLVEIDACVFDVLSNDGTPGSLLDPLNSDLKLRPEYFAPAARALVESTPAGAYLIPHWVCGLFEFVNPVDSVAVNAPSIPALLPQLEPAQGAALLQDLWGSATLGEVYANVYLDRNGPDATRQHLIALGQGPVNLDPASAALIQEMVEALPPLNQPFLQYYDLRDWAYPFEFAESPKSVMIGYSERTYYAEYNAELQTIPPIAPFYSTSTLDIKTTQFADQDQGTVAWTDGFVIPKGKLAAKEEVIEQFVAFVLSCEGYACWMQPAPNGINAMLQPALLTGYECSETEKSNELLLEFLGSFSTPFLIADAPTYKGVKAAGKALQQILSSSP